MYEFMIYGYSYSFLESLGSSESDANCPVSAICVAYRQFYIIVFATLILFIIVNSINNTTIFSYLQVNIVLLN